MKKSLIMAVIVLMSVGLTAQVARVAPRQVPTGAITLVSPGNEGYFQDVPVKITFRWQKFPGVTRYTLVLETRSGNVWQAYISRANLTSNAVIVTYDKPMDLRWRVLGNGPRGVVYGSPWWVLRYRGAVAGQGGAVGGGGLAAGHVKEKPKPQFYPVPISPKAGAVLRNFPRTMTFALLHSTNPAFRFYQIQVDIFHPRTGKWHSTMRGNTLLVDTMVRTNEFNYKFPADRVGRWRVRGVKNERQVTPWSAWRKFSFRARH